MTEPQPPGPGAPTRPPVEPLLREQRAAWEHGDRPRVEAYLQRHPGLAADPDAVLDLLNNEVVLRAEHGEAPSLEEYLDRFPHLAAELRLLFEVHRALEAEGLAATLDEPAPGPGPPAWTVPNYEIL